MDNNQKERKEIVNGIFLILQIAVSMMVPVCLGGFLGWLVGKWLNADYVLLIGFVLGAVAGYRNVYDMVKRYLKDPPDPEVPHELSEEEIKRMEAEEEFNRWRQERERNEGRG